MKYVNRWILLTESYVRTFKISLPRWGNAVNLRKIIANKYACQLCSTDSDLLIHRSSRSPFPAGER